MENDSDGFDELKSKMQFLAEENERLNQQVKKMAKTEKSLYKARNDLDFKINQVQGIANFILKFKETMDMSTILDNTIQFVNSIFEIEYTVAFTIEGNDLIPKAQIGFSPEGFNALMKTKLRPPTNMRSIEIIPPEAIETSSIAPIAQEILNAADDDQAISESAVVVMIFHDHQGPTGLILFKNYSVSKMGLFQNAPDEKDFPYFELLRSHVEQALERSRLRLEIENYNRTLERRVQEKTQELVDAQNQLLEVAHRAGMAEIATEILHNMGNVLNSVTTSTNVVGDILTRSQLVALFEKANGMVISHQNELATFFTQDEKGKKLPEFYQGLAKAFKDERVGLEEEIERIQNYVHTMLEIISSQQEHAEADLLQETINLKPVIENILNDQLVHNSKNKITFIKNLEATPPVMAQRSKLIQVINKLIQNAEEALFQTPPEERQITLSLTTTAEGMVELKIQDNGMGIDPGQITKIFNHGFTTKGGGRRGFGLHSCANLMTEMKGKIKAHSLGPGQGATFTLIFPAAADTVKIAPEAPRKNKVIATESEAPKASPLPPPPSPPQENKPQEIKQDNKIDTAGILLHNVGNVMNSIGVGTHSIKNILIQSNLLSLKKVSSMILENNHRIGEFFESDPKGKMVPVILEKLVTSLEKDNQEIEVELNGLTRSIEHVVHLISSHHKQKNATPQVEVLNLNELLDEVINNYAKFDKQLGIKVDTEFDDVPQFCVDRHRIIQILVNLLSNAKHVLMESSKEEKQILLRMKKHDQKVIIEIQDNGPGIDPANMDKIFKLGFTTRKTGNGFGLHHSLLSAKELGGNLSYKNLDTGGVIFTLEVPLQTEKP